MLSTLAGWQSPLLSLASAAAVTCAIMKPELSPASRDQERRQPREGVVGELLDPPLGDGAELGGGERQHVGGERHRLAVEVAARDHLASIGEDQRVVGDGVHLHQHLALDVGEQVAAGAVHLRHAAHAVGVLHPHVAAGGASRGSPSPAAAARGCARSPAARGTAAARAAAGRRRRRCRAAHRWRARRRGRRRAPAGAPPAPRARRSAVIAWVPLMSASPSFACSTSGARPARRAPRAAGSSTPRRPHRAAPEQRQRQVGERREVAARAHRAAAGHHRQQVVREQREQRRRPPPGARPSAPAPGCWRAAAACARTTASGSGSPMPAAWLSTSRSCSTQQLVGRDAHVGEVAEAGVDAVDDVAARRAPRSTAAPAGLDPRAAPPAPACSAPPPAPPPRSCSRVSERPSISTMRRRMYSGGALPGATSGGQLRADGEPVATPVLILPPVPMNDLFLRACRNEPTERRPVWLMRQAGRYLPEYRAVREKVDFLTLCRTPELAAEVTLQPVAASASTPRSSSPTSCCRSTRWAPGCASPPATGRSSTAPVRRPAGPRRASRDPDVERDLGYVFAAIGLRPARLAALPADGRVPLIGFGGTPWTLAAYLVEGGRLEAASATCSAGAGRTPRGLARLLDRLADVSVALPARRRCDAGAQAHPALRHLGRPARPGALSRSWRCRRCCR